MCRACFTESSSRPNSSSVQRDLRDSFVRHLNPEADTFPKTLGELTDRLKSWRNMLSRFLDENMPTHLQLYAESKTLQEMNLSGIEMPGQHTKGEEVVPEATIFLEKIGSEVAIIRRQGSALRRLALYGSDGHVQHFILQTGMHNITKRHAHFVEKGHPVWCPHQQYSISRFCWSHVLH